MRGEQGGLLVLALFLATCVSSPVGTRDNCGRDAGAPLWVELDPVNANAAAKLREIAALPPP